MPLIEGNIFQDGRGILRFVNDFDMSSVVRMYCIEPNVGLIRAWQGHKKETKWFYAVKGSFNVQIVDMQSHQRFQYQLNASESKILEIPRGFYNGFESLESGSMLLVFSDFNLEDSKNDDWRENTDNIKW